MRKVLLDTDILSEILKQRDTHVLRWADRYSSNHDRFTFSAITVHEIVQGLTSKRAERQLREARELFGENEVFAPTTADHERSGVIRGDARRQGIQLTLGDCLVGATAERLGLPVATGNTRHFQAMIEVGLAIELETGARPKR